MAANNPHKARMPNAIVTAGYNTIWVMMFISFLNSRFILRYVSHAKTIDQGLVYSLLEPQLAILAVNTLVMNDTLSMNPKYRSIMNAQPFKNFITYPFMGVPL